MEAKKNGTFAALLDYQVTTNTKATARIYGGRISLRIY